MPARPPRLHQRAPRPRQSGSADVRPTGSAWRKHRLTILQRYPLCVYCLPVVRRSEVVDHIVALSLSGTSTDDNLTGSCRDCNQIKSKLEQAWARLGLTPDMLHSAALTVGSLPYYISVARVAQMNNAPR